MKAREYPTKRFNINFNDILKRENSIYINEKLYFFYKFELNFQENFENYKS